MKFSRTLMIAGLCLVSAQAFAQWQWIGNDGRKVFSDRPPPANIPESRIIKSPAGQLTQQSRPESRRSSNAPQYGEIRQEEPKAATTAAAGGAAAGAGAAAGNTAAAPAGAASAAAQSKAEADKAKQAEAERKAEEQRQASIRAENCRRAKEAKNSLSSGMPMAKVDADGKQVMLDDAARAAELKRANDIIASDC